VSIEQLINDYFLAPIDERTGYNPVNTLVYAAIALVAAYLIYKGLEKLKIKTNEKFVYSIVPFILFGATLRVVVDANILPYNYLTTTPGIYVLIGLTTIFAVLLFHFTKKMNLLGPAGWVLFIPPLLILVPLFTYFDFVAFILVLALLGMAVGNVIFDRLKFECAFIPRLVVFAHALDGAATFVSIDVFSKAQGIAYFEQHVVTNALAQAFGGFWVFYVIKVLFAIAAVYFLEKSTDVKPDERYYIMLLLIIFGLAPGVRDVMRLLCGV